MGLFDKKAGGTLFGNIFRGVVGLTGINLAAPTTSTGKYLEQEKDYVQSLYIPPQQAAVTGGLKDAIDSIQKAPVSTGNDVNDSTNDGSWLAGSSGGIMDMIQKNLPLIGIGIAAYLLLNKGGRR